jgi:arsenate reductase (thioredoxin)
LKVLFLCTGNSARSILGEYLLRAKDPERFETYSAGAHPKGQVHLLALRLLREVYGINAEDARSKSWEEFLGVDFDWVITVCDNAKESCPVFPGRPNSLHWGLPDPADFEGPEEEHYALFQEVGEDLDCRIGLFCDLLEE